MEQLINLTPFFDPADGPMQNPVAPDLSPEALDKEIEKLSSSHDTWYDAEHANSKMVFYTIVSDTYAYYHRATHPDLDKPIRDKLWEAAQRKLAARNIQFDADVRNPSQILKAVFGFKNRQRVSNCSKVFEVAHKAKIEPRHFQAWLIQQGGIEAIRLSGTRAGGSVSQKQKVETGRDSLPEQPLLTFKVDLEKLPFGSDEADSKCLLIASYDGQGNIDVYGVVRKSQSALNAAFAALSNVKE